MCHSWDSPGFTTVGTRTSRGFPLGGTLTAWALGPGAQSERWPPPAAQAAALRPHASIPDSSPAPSPLEAGTGSQRRRGPRPHGRVPHPRLAGTCCSRLNTLGTRGQFRSKSPSHTRSELVPPAGAAPQGGNAPTCSSPPRWPAAHLTCARVRSMSESRCLGRPAGWPWESRHLRAGRRLQQRPAACPDSGGWPAMSKGWMAPGERLFRM